MHRFRATIEKDGAAVNSWCYVRLPAEVASALKGAKRVRGTIANEAFSEALQSRAAGIKTLLVKRELRDSLRLEPGQQIEVQIEADAREKALEIPPELAAALQANPDVGETFALLAPSHRREYADWIAQAKKLATKAARVERALTMITAKRHIT